MLNIKFLRLSRRLSQWELSRLGKISQGRYSMIERGLIEPTVDEVNRLASALDANPSTLFQPALMAQPLICETLGA